ncbi:MAG: MarR family transcriptional regulator [Clostridia bacterium]|nr:MarR family transcriptional regulator [Clostridia bacterium]
MDGMEWDMLRLENQLCFPLYACSKEIIRRYTPYLEPIGLTYTQYITMMVLWEKKEMSVKALGQTLYLDSGTMTPVLKKLEGKGFIVRRRSREDERNVMISLTGEGEALKEKAAHIPEKMGACVRLELQEAMQLQALLKKVLSGLEEE